MAYTEKDFSGCLFNPMADGLLTEIYPKLKSIANKDETIDKLLRYIIMCFDPKSPIVREERDYLRRKNIAYELSGLPKRGGEPDQDILNGGNEKSFLLTIKYLSHFVKEKEYAALCAFEFKYYENISELLKPIQGDTNAERLEAAKKKSVISDEIDKDIRRIDDYWLMFFGDKDLSEKVKIKKFRPEAMT